MNDSLLKFLQNITLYDFIMSVLFIISMSIMLLSQKDKIIKYMNKWRNDKNKEDSFNKLVYTMSDSINEIYNIINNQSQDINNLAKTVAEMKEKDSKTKRAEIKEKIERIYRECHKDMRCTDMQLEVVKELIEEYEEHGGTNSFVHSTVEPEIYNWKIIKEE